MGRQAYLTRIALGRSPFEEPELMESGEFILGPRAHDLDNQVDGYVQQFDEKGQPKNPAAKVAAKEFRHAKNEVMEAMGVVKRKGNQESKRRRRTEKENLAALLRENSYGPWLKVMNSGVTLLSLWWLMSLRRRFQTFRSFSSLPLLEIIKSEIRLLGPLTIFSSGLLSWFVTMPVTFCRERLVDIAADSIMQKLTSGEDNTVSRERYATRMHVLCQMQASSAPSSPTGADTYSRLDFTLFALAAPVLMFSDLQILHLIPQFARPRLSSLIPFSRHSPVSGPHLSRPVSITTLLQSGFEIHRSPIVAFWLYDRAWHAVEGATYRIVCATVPRPDLPDRWSVLAAHNGDDDEDTIPGLRLEDGPTLLQKIQYETESLFDWFRSWKFWGREKKARRTLEEAIRMQSIAIESETLFGPTTAQRPRPSESMAREIRRHAARLSGGMQRQTAPDDLDAWIGILRTPQTSSTNTPEPEDLFRTVETDVGGDATNDLLPQRELVAESTPLGPPEPDSRPEEIPVLVETHITPPPVRRARMLTSEDSISRALSRSQSRNRGRFGSHDWARELAQHRVTSLSNYPADTFAYHMSMCLTTVMMLPLESLYLRALAQGFLGSPMTMPTATAAADMIAADIRGLGAWFGGSERGLIGRMKYAGVMVLMWGMQAVISAGVWGLGTRVAAWIGRNTFGWGRDRDLEFAWE